MAKTSVHFQPCKEISEIHNYRKKKLDYVRTQLTNKNENWMWDSSKSLADRREEIRKLVKEKTGRKMQSKAVPLHEAVVVIDEKTTMDDLKKLGKIYQQRFGIECVHISIHRDEGHWVNRNGEDVGLKPTDNPTQEQIIEGVTWKPNLHAHMVFDWYNHDNGKSWKTSKQDARDMQTIAAEVLSMGRGQESTKQHLDGLSYKLAQKTEETEVQEIYIKNLQTKANILREQIGDNQEKLDEINRQKEEAERRRDAAIKQAEELKEQLKLGSDWLKEQQVRMEEVKQSLAKELKQLENTKTAIKTNYSEIARQEADLKAYNNKKAAKEAFKSASEGVKGLFGQSSKDKTIKALRDENKALSGEKEALQEKVDAIPQAIQAGIREQLAKERARERNNYRTLYKEITGKTFFFNDEGYNPNESLKAIRELKQDYEREKEFSTQWMKYAKELEQKEEKRWGRGRGIQ
jgi:putative plasmid recombination enzyme (fragment)